MIDWSSCPAVERDPERVSGAWVFRGTRVPVSALFENLEDGRSCRNSWIGFPVSALIRFVRYWIMPHERACHGLSARTVRSRHTRTAASRVDAARIVTAYERGWSKLKNGELLDAAEKEGFAVFVTTDANLKLLVADSTS